MNFYIIYNASSEVIDCAHTKARAINIARTDGSEGARVERIKVLGRPREVIRRLLAGTGGYAEEQTTIYTQGANVRKPREVHLECWRCQQPITSGSYHLDDEGPSHKPSCPS